MKYEEVKGDLFSVADETSLAHCISEDIKMGKGIAVLFKNKFGGIAELKSQGVKTGGCAMLKRGNRFVYYLITKKIYSHKPTYETLRQSLETMKTHCVQNAVDAVAMPKIGCGLDGLSWDRVSPMIQEVFADTEINVTVYYL